MIATVSRNTNQRLRMQPSAGNGNSQTLITNGDVYLHISSGSRKSYSFLAFTTEKRAAKLAAAISPGIQLNSS